jgi:hypothetical protein
MRLRVEIIGDLAEIMREEEQAGRRAVSAGVRAAGEGLKSDWRGQVVAAGLGRRLSNAVRANHYPPQPSMGAAALVYAQPHLAPKIFDAFEQGLTIRSRSGLWLAIPTDAAPKSSRGGRITPLEFERRTGQRLRFVYRSGRSALLVAEGRQSARGRYGVSRSKTGRGLATVPIFVLVPQVTIRKRLGLLMAAMKRGESIPAAIVENWPDR